MINEEAFIRAYNEVQLRGLPPKTFKAKQGPITLTVDAKLPDLLPFSDTELCSLSSNALENAIHACEQIPDSKKRIIRLCMYSKNNKLCINLHNSYQATKPLH